MAAHCQPQVFSAGIFAVVMLLLGVTNASALWTPPVSMDMNTNAITMQEIAADQSSNNAMAAFVQFDGAFNRLYAAKYDVMLGWQTPVAISTVSENVTAVKIAVVNINKFVMVYRQSSGAFQNIYAAVYNGTSWGAPTLLSSGATNCFNPTIAGNPPFNAIAAWQESNRIKASVFDGTNWLTSTQVDDGASGNADNPEVAFSVGGNPGEAIVVFKQFSIPNGSKDRIYGNKWSSNSWGTAAIIDNNGTSMMGPAIASDLAGNAMAVFTSDNDLISNKCNAGSWTGTSVVDNSASNNIGVPVIKHTSAVNICAHFRQQTAARRCTQSSTMSHGDR